MAKAERVKIYNKGGRHWPLKDNGNDVTCDPGKSVELNKRQADILVKNYPDDFVHGANFAPAVSGDIKKLKAENKTLKSEVEKLTAEITVLGGKVAELEAEKTDALNAKKNPLRDNKE